MNIEYDPIEQHSGEFICKPTVPCLHLIFFILFLKTFLKYPLCEGCSEVSLALSQSQSTVENKHISEVYDRRSVIKRFDFYR